MGDGTLALVPQAKRQAPPKPVSRSIVQSNVSAAPLDDYVHLVCDPKNAPVAGIPDMNNVPTICFRDVQVQTVTTGADGAFALTISPALYNSFATYTTTSGSTGTASWASSDSYTTITNDYGRYRMIVGNLEVRYLGAKDACSGRLGLLEANFSVASTALSGIIDNCEEADPADGFFYNWRQASPPMFTQIANDSNQTNYFQQLTVLGVGMPAGVTVEIRISRVYELQPTMTCMRYQEAAPTICNMHSCCAAANVHSRAATFGPLKGYERAISIGLKLAKAGLRLSLGDIAGATKQLLGA